MTKAGRLFINDIIAGIHLIKAPVSGRKMVGWGEGF
jgi:hypothetical protein